ncbi:hypothetical protein BsWGS_02997 [Bradybaena similaris]
MAPVQAEPKIADNEAACKAVIDMLERQLTDIQKASNEMAVVELLRGRTVQLMKDALETLKRSSQQEGSFTIIEKVTDIFVAGNEAGKEAKRCLVVSITESCIDVITSPEVILNHKIELLKSFNTLLENCPFSAKREILSTEHFAEKLSVLCKSIAQVGDYEVQVCIIEFIFRLVPKSMRIEYLKKVLDDSEQWLEFLDINDSRFEIDCRQFLNKLNKLNTYPMASVCSHPYFWVYSYPAEVVSIDGVKLYKPNDSGYDDFWVDLNEGSKRIGIFCEPNFLSSQQSQNSEQMWETVSIWAQDVKRYSCTAQGLLWKAIIELKAGAEMISNKEPETLSHLVTIVVAKKYNFKEALENVLKIHHKASSVDIPIRIVQKPDLPVKSSTALSESVCFSVAQTSSQKQEDRNAPSVTSSVARSKVSVPSEPMTTPASSVITSNTDQPILWQEIQERQRLQKKQLKMVSDASDNAGTGKMCAVELCDRAQKDKRHTPQVSNASSIACYTTKRLESETDAIDRSCSPLKNTGPNKSRNTTFDKENRTYNLNVAIENKNDVCEHSADRKSYRSRSQAKVKASEKCTNMTLHYMDARASDALVDVVNSQVTASGDRLFSSQASPAKHGPTVMSSKYGLNEVDKRIQCNEADAGEPRQCQLKGSCDTVSSTATDHQPAKTSARSLRSKQRTQAQATAVVTAPVTKSDTNKTQSDLYHSQLDIIPATLPAAQRPDTRQLRGNRKSKNSQNKIDATTGEDEIVKSSNTSIPKDMKPSNKKRKVQQADTEENGASKNINATAMSKVPNNSPGNISLDDFKPSKHVRSTRSVGRKVAEKSDNTACKKVINTRAAKDQNKASKRKQAKEKGNTCWLDNKNSKGGAETHSELKTLKDFVPVLQNREQIASDIHNKIFPQDISVPKDNDGNTSDKENQVYTVYIKSSSNSVNAIKTSELDKRKDMGSVDRSKDMQGEVASISSSGELFIVTEASKETDECDVIKETQYEPSSPAVFDTGAADTDKKQEAIILFDQLPKPGNVNSKSPDASGDCISSAVVTNASLNLENSYSFDKSTAMKGKCDKTTFEDKQSRLGNTSARLKSFRSKRTDRVSCKKKDENLVSELNIAKPSSARHEGKANVEVCVEKAVKSTKVKQLSQVNPCYEIQNVPYTTFVKEREQTSNSFILASPTRTLRSRNKTVSYKEYNSDDHSSCAEDVNSTSLKSQNVVVQTDVLDRSPSLTWNNISEVSPIEKLAKRQKDVYLNSKLGSQAPKKVEKSIETKKHIWTKHRMEKTVTTMSYSKSVYSLSTDPYDFEAESKKRYDTPSIVPLRSNFFAKDNLYGKSHSTYDKFHSAPEKVNYKKQGSRQFALQSPDSKMAAKNKSLNNVNLLNATHGAVVKWNSEPFAGKKHRPNYKKTPPSDASMVKDTSHQRRNRYLSTGASVDDINSGSERGSSQYCLYASQIEQDKSVEQDKSNTGLVFPHLEDSIPCTPLPEENKEDLDTAEKSVVSELSWLVQAKKALEKQDKKKDKGKSYPGHKSTETRHLTTYTEDLEPGPQCSRLHRQPSKTPDKLDETCKKLKMKGGTPGKQKFFSPLDFRTVTRKPQTSHAESDDLGDDCENRAVMKNQINKTLTPAIKKTSLELFSSEKKSKKNLSFRSPSIIENSSSEPADSISEDDYSLSKHQNTKSVLSAQSTSNAREKCDKFLSLVSSKLDQQLQDVTDSTSGSTECNLYAGIISGPSSYKRPTRTQLKRKYPDVSTSTENSLQESVIDVSEQATTSGLKPTLIPRKLFKSGVTPLRPDRITSSRNKTAHALKAPTEPQKCNQFSQAIEKHKKKKSGNLSHGHKEDMKDKSTPLKTLDRGDKAKYSFSERFDEKLVSTSLTGSKLVFDLCSPEKARSFNHSSWEDCSQTGLDSSPLIPLDLSSTHSPVVGFDEKSYAELNVDESGALLQTSLLDSVREELMKSRVSQVSDEPELSTEAGALDVTETASTEMTGLQEFLLKHNMKKIPLGSDIDEVVKSTHQHITSLWETDQRKSMNAVEKFQSVAQRIFTQMNKDLKEMQENELKVNLLWSQEMEKIRKYNMTQKKELTQLKKAHERLFCELERVHADSEVTQKSLKTVMKQDLDALQRKLVAKCNDHALDAMRRCLHMSLLL